MFEIVLDLMLSKINCALPSCFLMAIPEANIQHACLFPTPLKILFFFFLCQPLETEMKVACHKIFLTAKRHDFL